MNDKIKINVSNRLLFLIIHQEIETKIQFNMYFNISFAKGMYKRVTKYISLKLYEKYNKSYEWKDKV